MDVSRDVIEVRVLNLDTVISELNRLGNIQTNRDVGNGLKKAGNYLIRRGKEKLKKRLNKSQYPFHNYDRHRKGKGNLRKAFAITIFKRNKGVIAGFTKKGSHAHLIDLGTQQRQTSKGYNRGLVKANHFWTDTKNDDTTQAQGLIMDGLQKALDKLRNRRK